MPNFDAHYYGSKVDTIYIFLIIKFMIKGLNHTVLKYFEITYFMPSNISMFRNDQGAFCIMPTLLDGVQKR